MSIWDDLDYFSPSEFDYPDEMDSTLLYALEEIREMAGVPIFVSSDYRPGDPNAHGHGKAVDITDDLNSDGITSRWRFLVTRAALSKGIRRIGVYDKHIHLDVWEDGPQDVLWIGESS